MSIKIKTLSITGIRGIKKSIVLPLNEKSVLLYGDNGSGKSSISDSIEWFYNDKVDHLSNIEIDLKESLRNSFLSESEISKVSSTYNNCIFDATKTLYVKKGKLTSETINSNIEFGKYLSNSKKENLLLRYQALSDFVSKTKTEKLTSLSDIIGFSEVTKTKDILRKAFSSIKSEIKTQNFEAQINTQKQTLISKIGASISQEKNLYEKINEIITPLKTNIIVNSIEDIDILLNHIKQSFDSKQTKELNFLEDINNMLTTLKNEINFIDMEYKKYFIEFNKIADDVQSIKQIFLSELLKLGENVISTSYYKENICPLCLQPKNIEELKIDIQKRLKEIESSLKKKDSFDNAKKSISDIITERLNRIEKITSNVMIDAPENKDIKQAINELKLKLINYQKTVNAKVMLGNKLPTNDTLVLQESDFNIQAHISKRIEILKTAIKKNNAMEIYSNISSSKDAFLKIKQFEKNKKKLEEQKKSLELIYNKFVERQKEGLESFIKIFSNTINEFYQYMNPDELFHDIRIVTIAGEEDELKGITIEYKYNNMWVSPPQKYFSESHLNCFGISFFLASVIAFNNVNKFIILDDVISSFDTKHRKRFADLLFEKFSEYQIILLTHESEWFSYVKQIAKGKGWLIEKINWNETDGSFLDAKPEELKEIIERCITNGDVELIGNPIRKYLEFILKKICFNLDVKVSFRFNDTNENRMPYELLNALKAKINNHAKQDLKSQLGIIDRLLSDSTLANILSHDNKFNPKIGDIKALWDDIKIFEKLFYCQDDKCKNKILSIKNYDTVNKKIRCGCGNINYDWKE
jgi:energy-coupling factor transporter ATP-binding protein EcfA2